jgi:hypothetical protein
MCCERGGCKSNDCERYAQLLPDIPALTKGTVAGSSAEKPTKPTGGGVRARI